MEEEAVCRGAQTWGNKTWKCDSFCLFATIFCLFLLSFVWLSFFDSGRKMLAEEQQCWRKKLWTWTEIPSLLFTSLLGTKNNSTNCLFSASLPTLYCITRANFLFSLCTVLVSIHRTWHNYVHNDFCTQSDFFFLVGARETCESILLSMGQGKGMWCQGGFSQWGSSSKIFSCSVWSHEVFHLAFWADPVFLPYSFDCSTVSSTASTTGSFRKIWFASFSRTEESYWLICHLSCLGNQSLKSLLNNIPKGHFSSQPQLLFLFILVLFSWLLLLWFVIISSPLGWITRPKKGQKHPQRDPKPSLCSPRLIPKLQGWGLPLSAPYSSWTAEPPVKSGTCVSSFFRTTRSGHHVPGHQRNGLFHLLLLRNKKSTISKPLQGRGIAKESCSYLREASSCTHAERESEKCLWH